MTVAGLALWSNTLKAVMETAVAITAEEWGFDNAVKYSLFNS
jgi:hypothetical protein